MSYPYEEHTTILDLSSDGPGLSSSLDIYISGSLVLDNGFTITMKSSLACYSVTL